jgi:hypothetical protein
MSSAAAASSGEMPPAARAADGRVDLERRGGGDQLAIVLDGLHQPDQRVGALLLHKQLGEGRGSRK